MKFEDINSDKFLKFSGSAISSSRAVIRGGYITEGQVGSGLVDYYSTFIGSGGDGTHKPFTLSGNDTYKDGYGDLP